MRNSLIAIFSILVVAAAGWFFYRSRSATSAITPSTQEGSLLSVPPAAPVVAAPPAKPVVLSAEDNKKVVVLDQIFFSRNDNDPRMDTDLRHLSPALKDALTQKYSGLRMEARNERGTIAFLVGREINREEDVNFLNTVITEAPCLGMESCGSVDRGSDHDHLGSDVSLAYPQIVALRSYKNYLANPNANPALVAKIRDAAAAARSNQNPLIAQAASDALGQQ